MKAALLAAKVAMQRLGVLVMSTLVMLFAASPSQSTDSSRPVPPGWELEQELLSEHHKTDTESLIQLARSDRDIGTAWKAIALLGLRKDRQAVPALRALLSRNRPKFIRESAALSLAQLGDPSGMSSLRRFIEESDSLQRQVFLASALAQFDDPFGFEWVRRAARSAVEDDRFFSVAPLRAFAQMKRHGAFKAEVSRLLLALAVDKAARVRKEFFVESPGLFGTDIPLEPFMALARDASEHDPDPDVRVFAANLLAWRGIEHPEQVRGK